MEAKNSRSRGRAIATSLRRRVGQLSFDYYIRVWRDGEIWINAAEHPSTVKTNELTMHLSDLGIRWKLAGKPGTEGAFIVNIYL